MNRYRFFLVWLIVAAFCATSWAAEPSPESASLVAFPKGDFSCTVTVTPHESTHGGVKHSSSSLRKITIARVGNIRCDSFARTDGSAFQVWTLVDQKVSIEAKFPIQKKTLYILKGEARNSVCPKLLNLDAESLSWITKNAEASDSNKSTRRHYTAEMSITIHDETRTVLYQAWIDAKTLMPLMLDDGDALYTLTFAEGTPEGPLIIPGELQSELNRWMAALTPLHHL